jgi:hypothetical protein
MDMTTSCDGCIKQNVCFAWREIKFKLQKINEESTIFSSCGDMENYNEMLEYTAQNLAYLCNEYTPQRITGGPI